VGFGAQAEQDWQLEMKWRSHVAASSSSSSSSASSGVLGGKGLSLRVETWQGCVVEVLVSLCSPLPFATLGVKVLPFSGCFVVAVSARSAPSSRALNALRTARASLSLLLLVVPPLSPGLGLFRPRMLFSGMNCSSADFLRVDSRALGSVRRMEAFKAAISALSLVADGFEGGLGDLDGDREGDSGSFKGNWVVGSWKEGLRRWASGDLEVCFGEKSGGGLGRERRRETLALPSGNMAE